MAIEMKMNMSRLSEILLFTLSLWQCLHTLSGLTLTSRRSDIPSIFQSTNAYTIHLPIPASSSLIWANLVPPSDDKVNQSHNLAWLNSLLMKRKSSANSGTVGINESVEFSDPLEGARLLVDRLNNMGCPLSSREQDYLIRVFTQFQNIVASSAPLENQYYHKFKARIVSSRGPVGQKCPRWHVDHVPIRLVLSLIGPGSVYIPFYHEQKWLSKNGKLLINRRALNNLDEEDSKKANKIILPFGEDDVVVQKAIAGDAVLMMGKAWEDDNDEDQDLPVQTNYAIKALVHKSPDLGADEARVLLTVDVL